MLDQLYHDFALIPSFQEEALQKLEELSLLEKQKEIEDIRQRLEEEQKQTISFAEDRLVIQLTENKKITQVWLK